MLKNYIGCKTFILDLHVDTNIFKNYELPKDIDILIFGASTKSFYPLRKRVKDLIQTMNIKAHIIHDDTSYNKNKCDKELAKLINRSWLTLCTTSIFDYLVLKYFEVSACDS